MKRRKRFAKVLIILFTFLLLVGTGVFIIIQIKPEPPEAEIGKAREAISAARQLNAHIYAPDLFKRAEKLYDSSILLWKFQNQEWFLKRNFDKCRECAVLAEYKAIDAGNLSVENSKNLQKTLRSKIDSLQMAIRDFKSIFDQLPLDNEINKSYEKGTLLLSESSHAYQQTDYLVSLEKLNQATTHIKKAFLYANNLLSDYFSNYSRWQRWAEETIGQSKKNKSTAVLVDKFSKKCYVYKSGTLKYTFDVELGKNWIGYKRYKGDKATPEGFYHVTKKKQNHQTKYYKALLINYPNGDDKQRFNQDVKAGRISKSAQIGGLIEIHGGGGKGGNWTDGCIALTNKDMDVIFNNVSEGTPVT
ncbi:MAG: L,D-transpeptidase family protein, partial [Bacteroidales bacterium]|nr:L,D-transpeptidase family protein [Bacteroidales bacterium]